MSLKEFYNSGAEMKMSQEKNNSSSASKNTKNNNRRKRKNSSFLAARLLGLEKDKTSGTAATGTEGSEEDKALLCDRDCQSGGRGLGPRATSPTSATAVTDHRHRHRPHSRRRRRSLFVLHFRCCCCPCNICSEAGAASGSAATAVASTSSTNLPSSTETRCLIPVQASASSGKIPGILRNISTQPEMSSRTTPSLRPPYQHYFPFPPDSRRLRKLSEALFNAAQGHGNFDLMNDWEIGGTQNKWVCPSDRHLQLRAQLKSGWSVRTASARSPTSAKQNHGLTESEKEHIKAVLARAEEGKLREQQRIGKMIDRIEKMKARATGNGITQCYLCSTDFGLLAPKSYAAMCSQCRKYVCQKNCGVETYVSTRRETVFLCKICSEYREVMWKKSGAWFYKEIPEFVKPTEDSGDLRSPPAYHPKTTATWQHNATARGSPTVNSTYSSYKQRQSVSEPSSATRSPRARITPSWVREKVQTSLSVGSGSEEEDVNASTSEEEEETSSREGDRHHPSFTSGAVTGAAGGYPTTNRRAPRLKQRLPNKGMPTIHRFTVGAQSRIIDTDESGESRHTTPSTSPRHSHSSYGDDVSQNQSSLLASDAKSIDSGVVPSDYSGRISKLPTSADVQNPVTTITTAAVAAAVTAPAGIDDDHFSTKEMKRSSYCSRTPSTASSSGIQKTFLPSPETQTSAQESLRSGTLDRETHPPFESPGKGLFPEQPGGGEEIMKATFIPMSTSSNSSFAGVPPPIPPRSGQQTPLPVLPLMSQSTGSSSSSGRAMATPSLPVKQQAVIEERRRSSASSTSSVHKSGRSIESLPTTFEQLKMEEATTSSYMSASEDHGKAPLSKRIRSPFSWHRKTKKSLASKLIGERLSSAQSTTSLRYSTTAVVDQAVRHTQSGNDIIAAVDSYDADMLGSIQFALLYSAAEMKLHVKLIGAKNLRAMDKNGYSDPYVKLYLIPGASKATKITSKTIEKTLNPVWNEEFTYYGVSNEDRLKKSVRLLVLDRDRISSDFLGEVRVPLKKLTSGEEKTFNLYLEHAMPVESTDTSNERGKICMSIMYNVQQGSLYVTIKRCVELLGMDTTGFSDPYVKVSLLPLSNKAHRQKTSTKKRTLNPEFNETLTFIVPFKDLPKKTLQIDVFDKDVGKQDDYIGSVLLSTSAKGERQKQWNSCIQNPGNEFEQWHKLEVV